MRQAVRQQWIPLHQRLHITVSPSTLPRCNSCMRSSSGCCNHSPSAMCTSNVEASFRYKRSVPGMGCIVFQWCYQTSSPICFSLLLTTRAPAMPGSRASSSNPILPSPLLLSSVPLCSHSPPQPARIAFPPGICLTPTPLKLFPRRGEV